MTFRLCFVCLGNICRSPIAEAVMRSLLDEAGLGDRIRVSSAGTGDWHVGQGADERALAVLSRHGYDGSGHRARQFVAEMFADNDLIVAMDADNLSALRRLAPPDRADDVVLLRSFDSGLAVGASDVVLRAQKDMDVPDPYYGGPEGFEQVLDVVESACRGLVDHLRREVV